MQDVARCVGVLLVGGPVAAMSGELDVGGYWMTPDHTSVVHIRECGDGTPCGVVVAVDAERGGMTADHHNRDEDLRGRPMVGITLLHGFENDGTTWRSGQIYNPKDGRSYRARMELLSDDALAVSGCLGPICKTLVWERADAQAAAAAGAGSEVAAL